MDTPEYEAVEMFDDIHFHSVFHVKQVLSDRPDTPDMHCGPEDIFSASDVCSDVTKSALAIKREPMLSEPCADDCESNEYSEEWTSCVIEETSDCDSPPNADNDDDENGSTTLTVVLIRGCNVNNNEGGSLVKVERIMPDTDRKLSERTEDISKQNAKPFHCRVCGQGFVRSNNLRYHMITMHEQDKGHVCEQCGKCFVYKSRLEVHVRSVHERCRSSLCELCGKGFAYNSHLQRHIRQVHEKRSSAKCKFCGQASFDQSSLRRHVREVHENARPFRCRICGKGFGRASNFRYHVITVHRQMKPFSCRLCEKRFARSTVLRNHVIAVHEKTKSNRSSLST